MGVRAFFRNEEIPELEKVLDEDTARFLLSFCQEVGLDARFFRLEDGEWAIHIESAIRDRRIWIGRVERPGESRDLLTRLQDLCEKGFRNGCAHAFCFASGESGLPDGNGGLVPDAVIGLAAKEKAKSGGNRNPRYPVSLRYWVSYSRPISSWLLGRHICLAVARRLGMGGWKWEFMWGQHPIAGYFRLLNRFPTTSVLVEVPGGLFEGASRDVEKVAAGIVEGTVNYFRGRRRKEGIDIRETEGGTIEATAVSPEEPTRQEQAQRRVSDVISRAQSSEAISEYAKRLVKLHQERDKSPSDPAQRHVGISGVLRKKG